MHRVKSACLSNELEFAEGGEGLRDPLYIVLYMKYDDWQ